MSHEIGFASGCMLRIVPFRESVRSGHWTKAPPLGVRVHRTAQDADSQMVEVAEDRASHTKEVAARTQYELMGCIESASAMV